MLMLLEGVQDFFVGEIYGEVSAALVEKGIFGDRSDPLYQACLHILAEARSLTDDAEDVTPEKRAQLELRIQALHRELAELKAALKA